ncbi:hypothetical protein SSX86_015415 [Deinandra increscens subsp. villosa]|uniref:Ubiquitinyl hydrolase 1 n=1 Tax=Deinandra increscens subsp. villosa TaxID=3103831 RepID=A0AAP0GWL2_9ASTR
MSGSEGVGEISTENGSVSGLSPEQQKLVIIGIVQDDGSQAKEGDTFCLISFRWWRSWSAFVNQNPTISNSSSILQRPPSIDNSDLICESPSDNSTIDIYDTLVEGTHYILVTEKIWNQFYAWYGGGPRLARKAISRGTQAELTVEVYPLRLQLHLTPRVDQSYTRMSRRVNIWDYYGCRKHALLNDLDKTLDDVNIQMDQDILVEVIDHSVSYTTDVQVNGSLGNSPFTVLEPSRMNHSVAGGSTTNNGFSRSSNSEISQLQNVSPATEKGPTSFGVSTRGSCIGQIGLLNFGNTCFMNSAIQCLVHTPEFARFFIGDFHQEINWQNPLGMEGELAMAFGELLRRLWAPGRTAFAPRAFKAKLARFAPQFGGHNQHDSQELLAFLLDGLHEDLNRVKNKPYIKSRDADGRPDEQVADEYWANHISRNDSIIVDVCQGQYKSTLICPVCDKISVTFDPFMYLSLPLQSATPRTMTVAVFNCDGSVIPATCTVTVPKFGRFGDLVQALSNACSLKQNEKILLAEIQNHVIHQFFEDPHTSLSSIKDDACLSAYKIPKSMTNSRYLLLHNRHEDPEGMWKPYGTPLVFPISNDATITRGDIQLIAHTMLSPMLKPKNVAPITSSGLPSSTNGSKKEYSHCKENNDSLVKLPLKLVNGNNDLIDISTEEEKIINLSSSSKSVVLYIDWSPELMKKYEMHYLENLPEVSRNGHVPKKPRVEPLSLYTCIESFLREEPLVPEDMWFCPQCKERRQASKKLDLWRLPEVLVIHLKRFSYSRTMKSKLETFVNFPIHNFDLTKYVANKNNNQPQIYELYALANHYGNLGSGHYTAHVKLINENKWYNFDDNHVSAIGEDDVKSNAAYVLFYRRVNTDGVSSHSKIPWIAWKRITAPKINGGLGIGSLKAANLALLSKWGWRFKTEQSSLWVSIINAIHSSKRIHNTLPLRKSISGFWKPITKVFLDLANEDIHFWDDIKASPGNDSTVLFWHDTWLTHTNLKSVFPDLYHLEKSKSCLVTDRVRSTSSNTITTSWNWKSQPSTISELNSLSQLSSILLSFAPSPGRDRWTWLGCKNLLFSTSSIRRRLEQSWSVFSFKHQWSHWIPKKVDIFVWKAALNKIPAKSELQKRGIILHSPSCSWCAATMESTDHILFDCTFASNTWDLVATWTSHHINHPVSIDQAYNQASTFGLSTHLSKTLKAIIAATVWELWKARNGKEFEGRNTHPGRLLEEIKSNTFLWLVNRAKLSDLDWSVWLRNPLYWL